LAQAIRANNYRRRIGAQRPIGVRLRSGKRLAKLGLVKPDTSPPTNSKEHAYTAWVPTQRGIDYYTGAMLLGAAQDPEGVLVRQIERACADLPEWVVTVVDTRDEKGRKDGGFLWQARHRTLNLPPVISDTVENLARTCKQVIALGLALGA
jgi:hypothetical protein